MSSLLAGGKETSISSQGRGQLLMPQRRFAAEPHRDCGNAAFMPVSSYDTPRAAGNRL